MIIGAFYFRLTENENLIGEFFNDNSDTPSTESADKLPGTGSGFVGTYNSSWIDGDTFTAILRINSKQGPNRIFSLSWDVMGNGRFFGEGIVVDGILMGNYMDDDANDRTGLNRGLNV